MAKTHGSWACVLSTAIVLGCGGHVDDDEQRQTTPLPPPTGLRELAAIHTPPRVCERWNRDRKELAEGSWQGDVSACQPGVAPAPGRHNTLLQINLYRHLAGLPAVAESAAFTQQAQACALLMHANDALSHQPPSSWSCWSHAAAQGAQASNLAFSPGVFAVDQYMLDHGEKNAIRMGHRRWLLSENLAQVGVGSTSAASCLHVASGASSGGFRERAWPPPGAFPYGAYAPRDSLPTLDATGWTLESQTPFAGARVQVWEDDFPVPVRVNSLEPAAGSHYGLRFVPDGWQARPGSVYTVAVTGIAQAFSYRVVLVDCS